MFGVLSGGAVAICGASAALAIASVLPRQGPRARHDIDRRRGDGALDGRDDPLSRVCDLDRAKPKACRRLHRWHDPRRRPGRRRGLHDLARDRRHRHLCQVAARRDAAADRLRDLPRCRPQRRWRGLAPSLPLFLVGFALLVLANSFGLLPRLAVDFANNVSRWCLIAAIAALGMKTSFKDLFDAGFCPLALMVVETLWIGALVTISVVAFM